MSRSLGRPLRSDDEKVTFAEWDQCVAAGACKHNPSDHGWGRGDRPVIDISWDDAQEFIGWLSKKAGPPYRLPSEAEWEYAARGGAASAYWWGREAGTGHANCEDCGGAAASRQTLPAGSFRPNAFGLSDTAGNAAEWVQDCWNPSLRSALLVTAPPWKSGDCGLRSAARRLLLQARRTVSARPRASVTTKTSATTPMDFAWRAI